MNLLSGQEIYPTGSILITLVVLPGIYYFLFIRENKTKVFVALLAAMIASVILHVIVVYTQLHLGGEVGLSELWRPFIHILTLSAQYSNDSGDGIMNILREVTFHLFWAGMLLLAVQSRIRTRAYLVFYLIWLVGVAYPVTYNNLGNGLMQKLGIAETSGSVHLHFITGFTALAMVFYTPPVRKFQLSGMVTRWHILFLPFVLVVSLGAGWVLVSEVSTLPRMAIQIACSFFFFGIFKYFRRRKWKDTEPVALMAMNTIVFYGTRDLEGIRVLITAGLTCAGILYVFWVSLNYEDKDPAYFLWVVHGLGGLVSYLGKPFNSLFENSFTEIISVYGPIMTTYFTAIAATGAYTFLATYILLGIFNRVVDIKS